MSVTQAFSSSTATEDWKPFVVGEIHVLREEGEGRLKAGLWRVTPEQAPGTTEVPCEQDETVYIISGHVTVEIGGGETLELKTGSFASFVKGSVNRWTVREPTLEFFVYS